MPTITYHFKDLEEIAAHFEVKARIAEKRGNDFGPNIKQRFLYEAAAYYDVVNTLRASRIGGK